MLVVVGDEHGIGGRKIEDVRIEGRHGLFVLELTGGRLDADTLFACSQGAVDTPDQSRSARRD